jgi:hypothetical protein
VPRDIVGFSEQEIPTDIPCRRCGPGRVFVAAFTWGGERQLQWHCHACAMTWTTPDRRVTDRRTAAEHRYAKLTTQDRRAGIRRATERP